MNSALETLHIVAINRFTVCSNFSQGHEGMEPRAMGMSRWLFCATGTMAGLGEGYSHFWEGGHVFRWRKQVAHFVLFREAVG